MDRSREVVLADVGVTATELKILAAFCREHEALHTRPQNRGVPMEAFSYLWSINVNGNHTLGDDGAVTLSVLLRSNETLRTLYARGCGFTGAGMAAIAHAMAVNTTLQELHIGNNGKDSTSHAVGVHFGQALASNEASCLRWLQLKNRVMDTHQLCGRGAGSCSSIDLAVSSGTTEGPLAQPLCPAELALVTTTLADNPKLRSLSLAGSIHTEAQIQALSTAVKRNRVLRKVLLTDDAERTARSVCSWWGPPSTVLRPTLVTSMNTDDSPVACCTRDLSDAESSDYDSLSDPEEALRLHDRPRLLHERLLPAAYRDAEDERDKIRYSGPAASSRWLPVQELSGRFAPFKYLRFNMSRLTWREIVFMSEVLAGHPHASKVFFIRGDRNAFCAAPVGALSREAQARIERDIVRAPPSPPATAAEQLPVLRRAKRVKQRGAKVRRAGAKLLRNAGVSGSPKGRKRHPRRRQAGMTFTDKLLRPTDDEARSIQARCAQVIENVKANSSVARRCKPGRHVCWATFMARALVHTHSLRSVRFRQFIIPHQTLLWGKELDLTGAPLHLLDVAYVVVVSHRAMTIR